MRVVLLVALLALGACKPLQGNYRYVCQDLDHNNIPKCQHPRCEINGVCPEMLNGTEHNANEQHPETDAG